MNAFMGDMSCLT